MAHILEMIKSDYKYKESNLNRGKIIEELCGEKVYKDIREIIIVEIINAIKEKAFKMQIGSTPVYAISNQAKWSIHMDDIKPFSGLNLISKIQGKIKERTGLNRAQKRRALKKTKKLDEKQIFSWAIKNNLIEDKNLNKVIQKYIQGEIEETKIKEEYVREIARPTNILVGSMENYHIKNNLINPLIKLGKSFSSSVNKLRTSLNELDVTGNTMEIKKGIKKGLKNFHPNFIKDACEYDEKSRGILKKNGIKKSDWMSFNENGDVNRLPSLRIFYAYFPYYLKTHALTNRNPLESDAGDLIHYLYATYTDIFRADAYASNFIKEYCHQTNTVVVSRIEDLPKAIENHLTKLS